MFFEPYGELVSYELYCSNNLIFKVDCCDTSKKLHMYVLEALQDRFSNIHQDITNNGDTTTIVEYSDDSSCQTFAEYNFVIASIRHIIYAGKNSKDNIFLAARESDENILLVAHIRLVMSDLADLGVDIVCFKDGLGYNFNDYRKNFWTKKLGEM
ncbi:MAG: hypothetical protein ACTTKD_08725 [Peptoanaerobacter stomatis]|uniref:hypothetical protein n=1 Tax=Peptoanaerobacter stomatis TaxID=796937 RepID=UPI003F9FB7DF